MNDVEKLFQDWSNDHPPTDFSRFDAFEFGLQTSRRSVEQSLDEVKKLEKSIEPLKVEATTLRKLNEELNSLLNESANLIHYDLCGDKCLPICKQMREKILEGI